eukprot:CAMPEP_0196594920 /NCGR_PEP_ID=MMETSP1081-20130531/79661_1 /TAXON_ID=36882 /ORGANISM="Pyramimonas amylifera, Strain CCMP720" /LENGTH=273 /DNA_ID=CAMNT_0041919323 /DNA_START=25 /DNA_END=846 /DNA_ORIENTATION=+
MPPRPQEESIFKLIEEGPIDPNVTQAPVVAPTIIHASKKPGVATTLSQHQNSSQMSHFLNPVNGLRDNQKRNGIEPRNHARNNVVAIREASTLNHMKKMEADLPAPRRPAGHLPPQRSHSARDAHQPLAPNGENYIQQNMLQARNVAKKEPVKKELPKISDAVPTKKHGDFGKVPSYLKERKNELADVEARRRAAAEAEDVPEGMRLLPDDERLRTLKQLEETKKQVDLDWQKLPFNIETPGQIRHKQSLDTRLKEVEDAIKIFSRKKVFVRK